MMQILWIRICNTAFSQEALVRCSSATMHWSDSHQIIYIKILILDQHRKILNLSFGRKNLDYYPCSNFSTNCSCEDLFKNTFGRAQHPNYLNFKYYLWWRLVLFIRLRWRFVRLVGKEVVLAVESNQEKNFKRSKIS